MAILIKDKSPSELSPVLISIFVIIIALIIMGIYGIIRFQLIQQIMHPQDQGCTAEALICPDGTAVGRSGPDCAFQPCPTSKKNFVPIPSFVPKNQ